MPKDDFITVTNLNTLIKNVLISKFTNQLKIKGELSNIKISGQHTYLTLKDEDSSINITAWNSKFPNLHNGDDVIEDVDEDEISFLSKGRGKIAKISGLKDRLSGAKEIIKSL